MDGILFKMIGTITKTIVFKKAGYKVEMIGTILILLVVICGENGYKVEMTGIILILQVDA